MCVFVQSSSSGGWKEWSCVSGSVNNLIVVCLGRSYSNVDEGHSSQIMGMVATAAVCLLVPILWIDYKQRRAMKEVTLYGDF